MKIKFLVLIFNTLIIFQLMAQIPPTRDFFVQIKKCDLSKIWCNDSIRIEAGTEKIKFPEPFGFIGNNYQRFYIHFISVERSKENPLEYKVTGKTKVKMNICDFQGTIKITEAKLLKESDNPNFKQGFVKCQVKLMEDSLQNGTGYFSGILETDFIIDKSNNIRYDALMWMADGFCNNQFVGNWCSYKTKVKKKCNWGDFRIPECGDLDQGACEFIVLEKYLKFGWETYNKAWFVGDQNSLESIEARKIENNEWWK
jgi:hypothetical protein